MKRQKSQTLHMRNVIGHFKNTTLTNNTKYELRENIRKN